MKKTILIIAAYVLILSPLSGQQLFQSNPLQGMQHVWNPAFTAISTKMDVSAFYRGQYVSFKGAPQTAVLSIQRPFVDYNMSGGAQIFVDSEGPVSKMGVQLNYAYKLRELIFDDDQLSFGINGYFYQYSFRADGLRLTEAVDNTINQGRTSKFNPSFGVGMAYVSNMEEYGRDNSFFFGFSALQLLSQDLLLESGNAKRERHYFLNIGTKIYNYKSKIQPSLQVNFVDPQLINFTLSAFYEQEDSFWAGLSYSNIADLGVMGGVILDRINGRYTQLRLGAIASMNTGVLAQAGPSFEIYASYTLDLD